MVAERLSAGDALKKAWEAVELVERMQRTVALHEALMREMARAVEGLDRRLAVLEGKARR